MKRKRPRLEDPRTDDNKMSQAELKAEDMFFKNVCDTVENETEDGTTFVTPRHKIN
jgi:hypothetical protein